MKDMIKKNWFVVVIAVVLIAFVVAMIGDTAKTNVKKSTVDGKDVLFSYNDKNYFADEFYDELIANNDAGMVIPIVENEIYRNSVELTKGMKKDAEQKAQNVISQFKAQFGEDYLKYIDDALAKSGYIGESGEAGLVDYLTLQEARIQTQINYVKEDKKMYEDYASTNSPRMISHILIKMDDTDNPTKEQSEKLENVKKALAEKDADFGKIAKEFSEDPGSAEKDGSLGIVDKQSINNFVENFKNNVYAVGVGESTEWFATEHGMHIIHVDADDLKSFEELGDDVYKLVVDTHKDIANEITWKEIEKQKVEFTDKALYEKVKNYYNPKEAK